MPGKWMELEITWSEISQTQKDKDHVFSFMCAYLCTYIHRHTDTDTQMAYTDT